MIYKDFKFLKYLFSKRYQHEIKMNNTERVRCVERIKNDDTKFHKL